MSNFRPDLLVDLRGGQRMLIEIAVTSFVNEEKLARLKTAGFWALEIDLSRLLGSQEAIPSDAIRQEILHRVEHKKWVYPAPVRSTVEDAIPMAESVPAVARCRLVEYRYTINGMWVTARELPSGSLAVRSLAFSPQIRDLLKTQARMHGGYYQQVYRNWVFPVTATAVVLSWLAGLDDESTT